MNPLNPALNTNQSPSATTVGRNTLLCYQGLGDQAQLFSVLSADGIEWPDAKGIIGTENATTGPSLISFKGMVYAFYLIPEPEDGDSNIQYVSSEDGINWSSPKELPNSCHSNVAPATVRSSDNSQLFIYFRGSGDDTAIYGVFTSDGQDWNLING